jgi:hypothetical protein
MAAMNWKLGDRLYHAGRPEWGAGEVRSAESTAQDGVKCQRLTIRFERAGVKTLMTAFADLRPADEMPRFAAEPEPEPESWLAKAEAGNVEQRMAELPEVATDPFRTKRARMEATLGLYRFTAAGAPLLDWAAMQSGLKDPLSRFSRHQLEQFFERFKNNLDGHLRKLAFEMKREDPAGLQELAAGASPQARQALKRADGGR